jgi:hypothetical protein
MKELMRGKEASVSERAVRLIGSPAPANLFQGFQQPGCAERGDMNALAFCIFSSDKGVENRLFDRFRSRDE